MQNFDESMKLIALLYLDIQEATELYVYLNRLDDNAKRKLADATIRFGRMSMATTAVKSLNAKDNEEMQQYVAEFLNTKELCESTLGKICPLVDKFFLFKSTFNSLMLRGMTWIVDREELEIKFESSIYNVNIN